MRKFGENYLEDRLVSRLHVLRKVRGTSYDCIYLELDLGMGMDMDWWSAREILAARGYRNSLIDMIENRDIYVERKTPTSVGSLNEGWYSMAGA